MSKLKELFGDTGKLANTDPYSLVGKIGLDLELPVLSGSGYILTVDDGKPFIIRQAWVTILRGNKVLGSELVEFTKQPHTSKLILRWFKEHGVKL